jgi:hypothetical protein
LRQRGKPIPLPWRRALADIKRRATAVYGRYTERLARLNEELIAEFAPLRERLRSVRQATRECMERFDPPLPERPQAEAGFGGEEDWLFNSERDYEEQLEAYRARKKGTCG